MRMTISFTECGRGVAQKSGDKLTNEWRLTPSAANKCACDTTTVNKITWRSWRVVDALQIVYALKSHILATAGLNYGCLAILVQYHTNNVTYCKVAT